MEPVSVEPIPEFSLKGRIIDAYVSEVYDGDTITVIFNPFPDDEHSRDWEFKIRMLGYNAPEMRPKIKKHPTPWVRKRIKKNAITSRDKLAALIKHRRITLYCTDFDNFGRILGIVMSEGDNVNLLMLHNGLGIPYGPTPNFPLGAVK